MARFQAASADVMVLSLAVACGAKRELARAQLRQAVIEFLAALYRLTPSAIGIPTRPGQALQLAFSADLVDSPKVYLSFSHQADLSIAVLDWSAPVGIDLMSFSQDFDWQLPARDYLGPFALRRILDHPANQQLEAFADEWTRLEAGLKCLGLGLVEWSAGLEKKISACRFFPLQLPAGLSGTVARAV